MAELDVKMVPTWMRPRGWFQLGWSPEIGAGEVRTFRCFGEELVLYRTTDGSLHVLDAFCQHLGAHLGHGGTIADDCIVCPFHGWSWGPDGANRGIPDSDQLNRSRRLKTWATCERNGVVFVWHDADDGEPQWEPPDLFEAVDDGDPTKGFHDPHPAGCFRYEDIRVQPRMAAESNTWNMCCAGSVRSCSRRPCGAGPGCPRSGSILQGAGREFLGRVTVVDGLEQVGWLPLRFTVVGVMPDEDHPVSLAGRPGLQPTGLVELIRVRDAPVGAAGPRTSRGRGRRCSRRRSSRHDRGEPRGAGKRVQRVQRPIRRPVEDELLPEAPERADLAGPDLQGPPELKPPPGLIHVGTIFTSSSAMTCHS